jgi:DNA polymerase V
MMPPNNVFPLRESPSLSQTPIPAAEFSVRMKVRHLLSKISCGFPTPAETFGEPELDIAEYIIKNKAASFWLTTSGDSMQSFGVLPGSKVLVDRSITPRHEHIIVAVIDGEFTLKQLYQQNGVIELRAGNPKYKTIRFTEGDTLEIWGVVVACVRKFV